MVKKTILLALLAFSLGFINLTFGVEKPNPGHESNGKQRMTPDGSESGKKQSGPIAVSFGGTNKENEKELPSAQKSEAGSLTGVIDSLTEKLVRIKDQEGRTRILNLTENSVTTTPQGSSGVILKKGDAVRVRYNVKNRDLLNIQILN